MPHKPILVWIKGGGDLGTGVAYRLHRANIRVIISELPQPLAVRRMVAFANVAYERQMILEGLEARLVTTPEQAERLAEQGIVPVFLDPAGAMAKLMRPDVVVDARMAKRNLDTTLRDACFVIGLGPGFEAGTDVHAVIETMRGHNLGRVILAGCAEPDTQVPGLIQGHGNERLLRSPCAGIFTAELRIGDLVETGQEVARVDAKPVMANIPGVVRGLLHDGLPVQAGLKVGDIDPQGVVEHCFTISDKARAVGGGVLEAILHLGREHWSVSRHLTTSVS